ncbi:4'-phosphopantetheinyl transferase family protein [Streptomyces katsurahamanus]|uniref:4'-phosphopantetheinyl transferase superfamily protein n=1 Tax=Streptomyces katsurahamanus TaxID=2577098 RepID=A0ABW9NR24_9ACTN|nr:4'-phosphopantetheinyl transferase superfamily protein [Streptomyces katsurahamanus]MQS35757.1 4'-phosphopantetheinyl transferase superfamily protein [Streptomyces katsurahamanus]
MTRAVRRPAPPVPRIADTLRIGPLPATVVALSRLDPGARAPLHREEEPLLRALSPGRRPHFIVGRMAAARALRALGADGPVLRDGRRPVFPAGVRGSISHCVGPIGACFASANPRVVAVGTDLERTDRLSWDAAHLVCTPREYDWARRARRPESRLAVVFSAKEAVYKALSALETPEPVFHDVELRVARGRLHAHVAPGLLPEHRKILGWVRLLPGGHVITSVAVISVHETGKEIPLSVQSSEVI